MSKLSKLVKKFLADPPEARFEDVRYGLEAFGFKEVRSKGSHHSFEDSYGEVIVIPKKGGQKVNRTYIKAVVNLLNLEDWSDESEN